MDKWIIIDWYRSKDTPDFIGVAMSNEQIDDICDELEGEHDIVCYKTSYEPTKELLKKLENKGVIPKGTV